LISWGLRSVVGELAGPKGIKRILMPARGKTDEAKSSDKRASILQTGGM
jgi:hypothetical protein